VDGQPSPSRYSLVSLDGSALVVPGLYFAYKPIEQVRIGAGLQALVGTFKSTTVFSASPPDRLVGAPEDPQYDSFSELKVGPIFSPSANVGATFVPEEHVRIGVSFQAPHVVNAPARVTVRLPTAVEFDNAVQNGDAAHVRFKLPPIFRAGIEGRNQFANKSLLRVEATYVREFWSVHDAIDIYPDNIQLLNVTGFPSPFAVAPISLPRNFEDTNSFRLGGEYTFNLEGYAIDVRLGGAYEKSAIPPAWLSPLTIDLNKITVGIGGGLHIGEHWRLDGMYAHVFTTDVTVDPADARVPRVNPVKGNPTQTEAINGGTYSARADVLGVGLVYKF
jgi:long-chain fatty acid transport protein